LRFMLHECERPSRRIEARSVRQHTRRQTWTQT
jgi:hypothetical protein